MAVLLIVVITALIVLVVVLFAVHRTRPERLALGVRTKWGVIGLEVERPFYADDGGRGRLRAGDRLPLDPPP